MLFLHGACRALTPTLVWSALLVFGLGTLSAGCTDLYSGLPVETQQDRDIVFDLNGTLPAGSSGCVTGYIDLGSSGGYVGDVYSGTINGFSYAYHGAGSCKGFGRINELNNCESTSSDPFLEPDPEYYNMSAFCALIGTESATPPKAYGVSMSFFSFGAEDDIYGLGAITVSQ